MMSINGGDLKAPLIGRREGDEEFGGGRSTVDSTATPALASTGKQHSLGFGALVFLIYYNIGVPFGDEEVRSGWVAQDRYLIRAARQTQLLYCCTTAVL